MNDCNQDQTDDDAPLRDDVSDDAIEAAAVARGDFQLFCMALASVVLLGRRSAAKLLSKDEARRIAADIAKLPRSSVPRSSCTVVRPLFCEE
jgi:hypothetical protein